MKIPVGEPLRIIGVLREDPRWDTMRREIYINGKLQPHMVRGSSAELEKNICIKVGARSQFQGIFRELRFYARPPEGDDDPVLKRGMRMAGD